jgi:GT2 family glycosyltransferase
MIHNTNSNSSLTIIILNYNVRPLLVQCLNSIFRDPQSKNWTIIVVDNASTDDSVSYLKKHYSKKIKLIPSDKNLGFSAGNNLAVKFIPTPYTLFLNPDTLVPPRTIPFMLKFMNSHPRVGASTCRVELPNGHLDDSCHRGFPTPWNAFSHFCGLAKLFPHSQLFTGYSLGYLLNKNAIQTHAGDTSGRDPNSAHSDDHWRSTGGKETRGRTRIEKPHPIDACNGAFMLLRTKIGKQLNWWDEDYFWYGEDLDFCYRIKQAGHQIFYVPQVKITHFKGASSGLYSPSSLQEAPMTIETTRQSHPKKDQLHPAPAPSSQTRLRSARASTAAMRLFYRKHYAHQYPRLLTWLVLTGIELLQTHRLRKYSKLSR